MISLLRFAFTVSASFADQSLYTRRVSFLHRTRRSRGRLIFSVFLLFVNGCRLPAWAVPVHRWWVEGSIAVTALTFSRSFSVSGVATVLHEAAGREHPARTVRPRVAFGAPSSPPSPAKQGRLAHSRTHRSAWTIAGALRHAVWPWTASAWPAGAWVW